MMRSGWPRTMTSRPRLLAPPNNFSLSAEEMTATRASASSSAAFQPPPNCQGASNIAKKSAEVMRTLENTGLVLASGRPTAVLKPLDMTWRGALRSRSSAVASNRVRSKVGSWPACQPTMSPASSCTLNSRALLCGIGSPDST